MRRHLSIGLNIVLTSVLLAALVGQAPATAKKRNPTRFLTIAAASMAERVESEHEDGDNTIPDVCATPLSPKTTIAGDENRTDLNNGTGSYMAAVNIPNGMRVVSLSLFANDNDGAEDTHVFLVRNDIGDNISMPLDNYEVMAGVSSDGAVNNVLRRFTTTSIVSPKIDNKNSLYLIEMVVCPTTEPYAIQIAYKR